MFWFAGLAAALRVLSVCGGSVKCVFCGAPCLVSHLCLPGATTEYRDGFVGCLRAFLVNGQLQNLKYLVERGTWTTVRRRSIYQGPLYGVSVGCQGKCASSPCLNNGTCIEGYSDYSCNCRWTAFKGPICADGQSQTAPGSGTCIGQVFQFMSDRPQYRH